MTSSVISDTLVNALTLAFAFVLCMSCTSAEKIEIQAHRLIQA